MLRRTGEELPFVAGASPLVQPSRPAEAPDALPGLARAHQKFGGTAGIDLSSFQRTPLPFGPGASPPAASEAPAPPPMIGPLATAEMAARPAARAPSTESAAEVVPEKPQLEKPAEPELPLERYPLERCAAITASMARRKAERGAILEQNELTAEVWAGLEQHWAEVIQKDLERGKMGSLRAFDAAYVGRLEEERGPVTVEEYARLVVAGERGTEMEVLDALGLPRGAMIRIKRVWDARTVGDAALGRRVRKAVVVAGET
jgi:hypothetical protein